MQTRRRSLLEAKANIVVGIIYAFVLNYVLIVHVSWSSQTSQAFWMTTWFTIGSFIRQYFIRRAFNWWDVQIEKADLASWSED